MSRIRIEGETNHPKELIAQEVVNAVLARLASIKETLRNIETDLAFFRRHFGFSDSDFLEKFHIGEFGDDDDAFAWEASLKLRDSLAREESSLREAL